MKHWHIKKKGGLWCAYCEEVFIYDHARFRRVLAFVEEYIKGDKNMTINVEDLENEVHAIDDDLSDLKEELAEIKKELARHKSALKTFIAYSSEIGSIFGGQLLDILEGKDDTQVNKDNTRP